MYEDEQILLQNLSHFDLSVPLSKQAAEELLIEMNRKQEERRSTIITEKQKQRRYYIDWNKWENHDYFTKTVLQDAEAEPILPVEQQKQPHQCNYKDLNQKLQLALDIITKHTLANPIMQAEVRAKEGKKRSQSIEPKKEREKMLFSKREEDSLRKKSVRGRVRTEMEESWQEGVPIRTDKYQVHPIIREQQEQVKQNLKENAMINNFLASIAQWQQRKERKKQERMEQEIKLSMEGVTFTPEINARSRQIMKRKGAMAPIYQREGREKKRELTERFNIESKMNRSKY